MSIYARLSCAILLCTAGFCQSTEPGPKFEAADIHPSPATRFSFMQGPFTHNGRYEVRIASMADLVSTAYGVDLDNVWGGPAWLEMDRFDITAKAPANSNKETLKVMLQALLADRFHLVAHKDTKPMPAFALTASKHPLLKKSDGEGETGCKFTPPARPPQGASGPPTAPVFSYACHNVTMASLAEQMRDMPASQQFLNDRQVVDQTGLEGGWDFNLKYSFRGRGFAAEGETVTFADAIEKQLGLKLDPVKIPMPVIVVDSVDQKPTPNPPGVMETLQLSSPPTEFEVAVLKPTDPDFKGRRFQIQPGGRITVQGMTLKFFIEQAWNLTDDMLVGAPKWLDSDRFDLIAKAPGVGAMKQDENVDFDAIMVMLRSLVEQRFKLATHMEMRPISAYTLMAVKPKMKKADPASRTRFREGPSVDGKDDPRNKTPILSRLVTCQNMTMAQFADKLQSIAPGYIHTPVLDATGLEGSYDFTLSFSPIGAVQGGRGGRDGGGREGGGGDGAAPARDTLAASDPTGAVSLPEAIEKQLGLKLELQKRPVKVLVIDHVEQKPVDN